MPSCPECGSEKFTLINGLYFCAECSTQSQEIAQQEQGELINVADQSFKSFLGVKGVGKKRDRRLKVDIGKPWKIVEGFQVILKWQIRKLIDVGCRPELFDTMEQIWFSFLHSGGHVEMMPNVKAKKKFCNFDTIRDDYVLALHYKEHESEMPCKSLHHSMSILQHRVASKLKKRARTKSETSSDGAHLMSEKDEVKKLETELRLPKKSKRKKTKCKKSTFTLSDGEEWFSVASSESEDDFLHGPLTKQEKFFRKNNRMWITTSSIKAQKRMSAESLTLRKLLALLYVGLQWNREVSVTLPDLIRLARQGYLPYLETLIYLEPHMKLVEGDARRLRSTSIPNYHQLICDSENLLEFLDLKEKIPAVNVDGLVKRYVDELNLPLDVARFIRQITKLASFKYVRGWNWSSCKQESCWKFSKDALMLDYQPHLVAVSLIVVALKLLIGLDGTSEYDDDEIPRHHEGVTPFNWRRWKLCHEKRLSMRRRSPLTTCDGEGNDEIDDVQSLAQHCGHIVMASAHIRKPNITHRNHLERNEGKKLIFEKLIERQGSSQVLAEKLDFLRNDPSFTAPHYNDEDDMRGHCIKHLIYKDSHAYVRYTDGYARKEFALANSDILMKHATLMNSAGGDGVSKLGEFHSSYLFVLRLCKGLIECCSELPVHSMTMLVEKEILLKFV